MPLLQENFCTPHLDEPLSRNLLGRLDIETKNGIHTYVYILICICRQTSGDCADAPAFFVPKVSRYSQERMIVKQYMYIHTYIQTATAYIQSCITYIHNINKQIHTYIDTDIYVYMYMYT